MAGKKKRKKNRLADPGKATEFKANPFAELNLDLPEPEPQKAVEPQAASGLAFEFEKDRKPALIFSLEKKGRGGKAVTLIRGFEHASELEQIELLSMVKQKLGIGGWFEEGTLELQGDQRKRAADWFVQEGYRVRGDIPGN